MRLRHFTTCFLLIFFSYFIMNIGKRQVKEIESGVRNNWCENVRSALDCATEHLIAMEDGNTIVDCEEVIDSFVFNYSTSCGIENNRPDKRKLSGQILFLIIMDEDGYFLWHNSQISGKQSHILEKKTYWEEKKSKSEQIEEVICFEKKLGEEILDIKLLFWDDGLWERTFEKPGMVACVQDEKGSCFLTGTQVYKTN